VSVNFGYPIGTSPAESSLAKAKLEYQKAETQIRNIELQVGKEVRSAARTVSTNLKRVDATRASRELAQRRLEAEQKKFTVGLSTTFLVFQAQRDLAEASNNELQAITDYLGSVVEFEAVQEIGSAGAIVSIGLSQ
jgi:outer membrane protein TolC